MTRSNKMKYYNYYNKMLNVLDDYTGKIKFYDSYFKVTDDEFTIRTDSPNHYEEQIKVSILDYNYKYLITVRTDKNRDYTMEILKDKDQVRCYSRNDIKESTFNNAFNRTLKYLLKRLKEQANYDRINNLIAA